MNTPDEIIAVVTAFKAGKQIQWRTIDSKYAWVSISQPSWDFSGCEYRVKPERKRLWTVEGQSSLHLAVSEREAKAIQNDLKNNFCTPIITEYVEVEKP